jgi:hypothetical protein
MEGGGYLYQHGIHHIHTIGPEKYPGKAHKVEGEYYAQYMRKLGFGYVNN